MVKVYVETEDMSKEDLVQLLIDKDKKIEELEHFKFFVLNIYQKHKVSDTYRILSDKKDDYVKKMEDFMAIENSKTGA